MKVVLFSDDRGSTNRIMAYHPLSGVGLLAKVLKCSGYETISFDLYSRPPGTCPGDEGATWASRKSIVDACDAVVLYSFDSWGAQFDVGYAIGIGKPVAVLSTREGDEHVTEFGATLLKTPDELLGWLEDFRCKKTVRA